MSSPPAILRAPFDLGLTSGPGPSAVALPLRYLAGPGGLDWSSAPGTPWQEGPFEGLYGDGWYLGYAQARVTPAQLEGVTHGWFTTLFRWLAARDLHLARCWSTIPDIHAETAGLEHYRAFSRGRFEAFANAFGDHASSEMPAATGVGTFTDQLTVAFLAVPGRPRHFENERQVPAYQYPSAYGPRPPAFARATVTSLGTQPFLLVAGTAAVRGHVSVFPGDVIAQTDETLLNLATLGRNVGHPDLLGPRPATGRQVLVYLRQATDLAAVTAHLEAHWLSPLDQVTYAEAEICRADLEIEIELLAPIS